MTAIPPRSVCPICLRPIQARHETEGADTYLIKECPKHGEFRTIVWRGNPEFQDWSRTKIPSLPKRPATRVDQGCPLDCGLCDMHRQHTCTAVLEITWRCDLGCPVCFASSGKAARPDLDHAHVSGLLDRVKKASGLCNIQLSGGEPTIRNDLPELIALTRSKGFPFVQLNTNGLRLGREPGYARTLADAGLDSVFFQFDGTRDGIFETTRGKALLDDKLRALDNLAHAGIGIVLVPTVIPGVNTDNLGDIVRLAAERSPAVRGVHFQPVSYFGRYPQAPTDDQRITLPEIMRLLEEQTDGSLRTDHFLPPGCEHSHCSFHGNYIVMEDGTLKRLASEGKSCCAPAPAEKGAVNAKAFVARQWAGPDKELPMAGSCCGDDLDRFLNRAATHTLAISAMAFQDAWTLDIERLKGCCIHEVAPDGRLIPFCAYNLTSMDGESLYRGKCHGPLIS